jgi:DNA-binding beta-propeller fold protein YncE
MSTLGRVLLSVLMVAVVPQAAPSAPAAQAGRTLYVTHGNSASISAFAIGPDGVPALIGRPLPIGGELRGMVFSPDGSRAFVADTGNDRVVSLSVGTDGSLTELPDPAPTGDRPQGIAIAPSGDTVYTANTGDSTVSVLAVGADDRLRPRGPAVPIGGENPRGIALTPDGRFLFTANGVPGDFDPDTVSTFAVRPAGTLTLLDDSTPIGPAGNGIAVSPDGRFLYVACEWGASVFGFAIGSGGRLSPVPNSPFAVEGFPVGAATTPDGRRLYIASGGSPVDPAEAVLTHGFDVGADGSLTPVPGSPVTSGSGPVGISPTPDGRHLYVSNVGSDNLSGYTVDPAGTLREIAGSPFPSDGDRPLFQSVVVRPNQGPTAWLAATGGRAGLPVRFDASGSLDPDGHVARYDWDFGDGTASADGPAMPEHTYRHPGRYTVSLLVTDDEGCAARQVFTGQSLLCHGTGAARVAIDVTVGPR